MKFISKLFLTITLIYTSNSFAGGNDCFTNCSPDGVGGMVCNTSCPQNNGTVMDAFNEGREQAMKYQLMQERMNYMKQLKQDCDQGNTQACSDYRTMLMNWR